MPRLLLIGPPGSGKGTQAARLAGLFAIPAISTGDIFRQNIENGTPLGKQVQAIVESGEYVPDSLTNDLVRHRLEEPDAAAGFLLDGYPRTLDQVAHLDHILAERGTALDAVIRLAADTDELVTRLRKRSIERGRSDDTEEAIRHRQDVFAKQTAPLVDVYDDRGSLVRVDGLGTVDEVADRILHGLAERGITPPSAFTVLG
ncbi:MAG: adenylate kinase [Microbacteriaceae bacterium]